MNYVNHQFDLELGDELDLFAEELGFAEAMQHCTYGCASTAASVSTIGGCFASATTFSTFSSECCAS